MLDAIPAIYVAIIALLIGFAGLMWSADKFVLGSASIAKLFGLSPLVIGLTIVSFGTSAPEVIVSISASLRNTGDLAIGNAIGSNIANVALVLGATMLIAKIPVQKHILIDELPVLLSVTILAGIFLFDATLTRIEGWILLALLIPVMIYLVKRKQKDLTTTEIEEETEFDSFDAGSKTAAIGWFIFGLALLIVSSEVLVWGAKTTATHFGVSPLIVGLTIIALGTSLPELAASIASARKGHHDIALGNIIGSNIFNLLAVMSIPGAISVLTLDMSVFIRDYGVMLATTMILAVSTFWVIKRAKPGSQATLGKPIGIVLLVTYISYYIYLFLLR